MLRSVWGAPSGVNTGPAKRRKYWAHAEQSLLIPLGGNAQTALAVLDGRAGKPAFAGTAEVAGVGEAEQEADFGDAVFAVRQQVVSDVFPFPVKQGVKGMPFFFQAALQGARGEVDMGGDIG